MDDTAVPRGLARLAAHFGAAMRAREMLPSVRVSVVLAEAGDDNDYDNNAETAPSDHADTNDVGKQVTQSLSKTLGEQLSIGGVLGFATGYSIRKVGRALLFVTGTQVCILQYMAYREWLVMDWRKVASDVSPTFTRSTWDKLLAILCYKMPFNIAFTGGLMAGLRLSAPPGK